MKVSKAFEKLYNLLPKLDISLLNLDQKKRVEFVANVSYFYKDSDYQPPKKEFAYPKKFRLETERIINLLLKNVKLTTKRKALLNRIKDSINKEAFNEFVEELKTRPTASKKYLLSFLEKVKRKAKKKKIKNPLTPVFCYGSNSPSQLAVRLGRKIEAVPAYLPHHILTFNGMSSNWQSPAGSIARLKDFAVIGSIAQVTEDELLLLDQFEGLGFAYKRKKVMTSNGKAFVYVNMKQSSNKKPSRAYLKAVVTHLKSFWPTELVKEYIKEVFINQYDDTDLPYQVRGGNMAFQITAAEKKLILARRKSRKKGKMEAGLGGRRMQQVRDYAEEVENSFREMKKHAMYMKANAEGIASEGKSGGAREVVKLGNEIVRMLKPIERAINKIENDYHLSGVFEDFLDEIDDDYDSWSDTYSR